MRGLVILEGPDGTGKTTLAKELCRRFNGRYLHMTYRFKKDQWTYHLAMMMHAVSKCTEQLVVLDRCWMSESIYAEYFRGGSDVPHLGRFIDRIARRYCATYVMCLPPSVEEYRSHFEKLKGEREEMYDSPHDMANIAYMYYDLWSSWGCRNPVGTGYHFDVMRSGGMSTRNDSLAYTYQEDSLDLVCDSIRRLTLIRMKSLYDVGINPLSLGPNLLGNVSEAKYLFIGDKSDTRKRPYGRRSFPFMTYGNGDLLLAETMSSLQIKEEDCCYVNANDPRGPELVHSILAMCPHLTPVFVGPESERQIFIRQIYSAKRISDPNELVKSNKGHLLKQQLKDALL